MYSTTKLVQRVLCILWQDSRQTSDESVNYPCVLVEAGHKPLYTGGGGSCCRTTGGEATSHHTASLLNTQPPAPVFDFRRAQGVLNVAMGKCACHHTRCLAVGQGNNLPTLQQPPRIAFRPSRRQDNTSLSLVSCLVYLLSLLMHCDTFQCCG